MRSVLAGLAFVISVAVAAAAFGAGPADPLLRLVPADAGATLVIEDLRGHVRDYYASPLAAGVSQLPAVRAWLASPSYRRFEGAFSQFEKLLGKPIATVRDDLIGDALVLTLRVPPGGRQQDARGMVLARVRDRPLLERLIDGINAGEKEKGDLVRLSDRERNGLRYQVREFPVRLHKPTEFYIIFDDGTFAWSNSEALVQGVIDRDRGARDGLGDSTRFRKVRDALPARSAVSLYMDPRVLEAMLAASSKPSKPRDERLAAMLGHYVGALDYIGGAVEWRPEAGANGAAVILHIQESIDAEKLPLWLRRWAARPAGPSTPRRVPAGALAAASFHVDFPAFEEMLRAITPSPGQAKLDNLVLVLSGLMLGRDLRTDILPKLGPALLVYLEEATSAESPTRLAVVASLEGVDAKPGSGVAPALDNALRTLLATYALDGKHGKGQLRVETQPVPGGTLTRLSPSSPAVYALAQGRLLVAKSDQALARALAANFPSAQHFGEIQANYFDGAETFLYADMVGLHRFAGAHRPAIAKRLAAKNRTTVPNARRDLDQALALMALFRDGFVTSRFADDARSAHRMIGLTIRVPDAH